MLLPKMPEEILAEKKFNSVPYVIGINKQEFGWLLPMVRMWGPLRPPPLPVTSPPHLCLQGSAFPGPPSESRAAVPFARVDVSMGSFSRMVQVSPGDPCPHTLYCLPI